jgi:plastocyanin
VRKLVVALLGSTLLLAACSGGKTTTGGTQTPTAAATSSSPKAFGTCAPAGTKLKITASGLTFDKDCLAAVAGTEFTIQLTNDDHGVQHNIHIFGDATLATTVYQGPFILGVAETVYSIRGVPKGTYYFHCDRHPQMEGAFLAL